MAVTSRATVLAAVLAVAALAPSTARADGEVSFRGAYYKEKATKVQQPMVDATLDAGEHGEVKAHFLVDVITSASVAAGNDGSQFNEIRYETGAFYLHDFRKYRLGLGYRASTEPDYLSLGISGRGEVDFAQRNTTLGLSVYAGRDSITNGNAGGMGELLDEKLTTTLASVSLTQVVSPVVVAALTYDVAYLDGYTANPYRVVIANGMKLPETHPDSRLRHALFGSVRAFVIPTETTLVLGYRYYIDDWGLSAHTPEARAIQEVASNVDLRLRYRYYRQTAVDFYKDIYDEVEEFMTDDSKLDAFDGHTVGAALSIRLDRLGLDDTLGRSRAEVNVEYVDQNNRYGRVLIGQVALTMPVDY